ncbi:hypothetical protein TWF481_007073 [Arthrobotrys musiformis]|uniref:Uncharacterized protein n=1 Tax=Arthrobotrys musiformis TaxID=47236 RepID=A0AAV9WCF3_9PEZI
MSNRNPKKFETTKEEEEEGRQVGKPRGHGEMEERNRENEAKYKCRMKWLCDMLTTKEEKKTKKKIILSTLRTGSESRRWRQVDRLTARVRDFGEWPEKERQKEVLDASASEFYEGRIDEQQGCAGRDRMDGRSEGKGREGKGGRVDECAVGWLYYDKPTVEEEEQKNKRK